MMENINIKDTLNLANKLKDSLPKLMKMQNDAINQLPEDQRQHLVEHQIKINDIMRTVKSGDLNAIQKLVNNHADTTTK